MNDTQVNFNIDIRKLANKELKNENAELRRAIKELENVIKQLRSSIEARAKKIAEDKLSDELVELDAIVKNYNSIAKGLESKLQILCKIGDTASDALDDIYEMEIYTFDAKDSIKRHTRKKKVKKS